MDPVADTEARRPPEIFDTDVDSSDLAGTTSSGLQHCPSEGVLEGGPEAENQIREQPMQK